MRTAAAGLRKGICEALEDIRANSAGADLARREINTFRDQKISHLLFAVALSPRVVAQSAAAAAAVEGARQAVSTMNRGLHEAEAIDDPDKRDQHIIATLTTALKALSGHCQEIDRAKKQVFRQ